MNDLTIYDTFAELVAGWQSVTSARADESRPFCLL